MDEAKLTIDKSKKLRILVSGGGTGGHIFPAIAIADELKMRFPNSEFLFIGAQGRMEMEKVPQAGYRIIGLNIAGFNRSKLFANLSLPFKIFSSLKKANKAISAFKPDFAIGTGGFASGPALYMASRMKVPIFVQEQNSLPGKTNIFLAKWAKAVFTAYPAMETFFTGTTVHYLGNPIRQNIISNLTDRTEAKKRLGLNPDKLVILSVGGSQGSRTINKAWKAHLNAVAEKDWQLVWQTGKLDFAEINAELKDKVEIRNSVHLKEFIADMALHYSAADVIVSRAGAIAISELAVVGRPVILVPLPTAAEDHQTANARNLVEKQAASMVTDAEMAEKFWPVLKDLGENGALRQEMSSSLQQFAKPDATSRIVDEILKITAYNGL